VQKSLLSFLILLTLLTIAAADGSDAWIVRDDGVGPVKIGMTLAQLRATLHQKLPEENDAASDNCFYVRAKGHEHIAFMIEDGKLVRIDVNAPAISTTSGLQVGDSEARVRQLYGSKVKVTPHKYVDTGHYLTVRLQDRRYGIRFETDKGKITKYYVGTYEAIQYVEGCL
jgi:hypothetical protein